MAIEGNKFAGMGIVSPVPLTGPDLLPTDILTLISCGRC